ncbi:MAG: acyl-CoA dehydrogenase [Alphaproteobacteria bacterium]
MIEEQRAVEPRLDVLADCDGMRALLYTGAFHEDLVNGGGGNGADAVRAESRDLVEWLLPLIKAGASDSSFRIANQAIQLHGGHGYVADHGVEQLARDGRINAIYEGANAIQGIDLVTRKLGTEGGRRQRVFLDLIRADIASLRGKPATREIAAALETSLPIFEDATRYLSGKLGNAPRDALAGASPYLDLVATIAVGWMWLRMAAHADPTNPAEAIKPVLARFFAEHALSGCDAFARQAKAGAATLDLSSAEQLRAW